MPGYVEKVKTGLALGDFKFSVLGFVFGIPGACLV
jgi:hypothetical protein